MDAERFEKLLIGPDVSVREAVMAIDAGAIWIALVVDERRRLLGTVSDGDVRRALLRGTTLDDPVHGVIHRDPFIAPLDAEPADVLRTMTEQGIDQVPLVDQEGRVLDVAFIHDLVAPEARHERPRVVLMAGGEGLRLRPLTDTTPKPMLPVGEAARPLLEHTLEQIAQAGFQRVLLAVNYKAEAIEGHFGSGEELGLDIRYVREQTALGSAGALNLARDELNEPFIVMNADLLTNLNLAALFRFHAEDENSITVGVRRYALEVPYGVVEIDGTRVTALNEKPTFGFFVNAGLYAVNPEAVELMPSEVTAFNMTDLIDATLTAGLRVGSFPIREYWLDIGQFADYERVHNDHATYFAVGGR